MRVESDDLGHAMAMAMAMANANACANALPHPASTALPGL